jgi:PAS domain S-box-containing protein
LEPVHSIDDFVSREGRAGLVEVLHALAEAVLIVGPEGQVEFANRAACAALRGTERAELEGDDCIAALREWLLTDEQGNQLDGETLLRGDLGDGTSIRAVRRTTGELRWWRPESRALRAGNGEEAARLVALDDVTAVKEAEMRMRVLADSGRALVASLDYEETLANVAQMAVPALADWCALYLADEGLNVRRVVAAHRNPEKQVLAERVRERTHGQGTAADARARAALVADRAHARPHAHNRGDSPGHRRRFRPSPGPRGPGARRAARTARGGGDRERASLQPASRDRRDAGAQLPAVRAP